jgi:hypothetical protein
VSVICVVKKCLFVICDICDCEERFLFTMSFMSLSSVKAKARFHGCDNDAICHVCHHDVTPNNCDNYVICHGCVIMMPFTMTVIMS